MSKIFLLLNTLHTRLGSSPYELRLSTGACWQGGGGGGRATGGKGERPVTWLKQLVAANHRVFVSIHHLYFFQFLNRICLRVTCVFLLLREGGEASHLAQATGGSKPNVADVCAFLSAYHLYFFQYLKCFSLCKKYFF